MMFDSIVAFVENGDGDGYHLALTQGEVAIAVHESIVKGHDSTQSGRIEAMRFDDVIDAAP